MNRPPRFLARRAFDAALATHGPRHARATYAHRNTARHIEQNARRAEAIMSRIYANGTPRRSPVDRWIDRAGGTFAPLARFPSVDNGPLLSVPLAPLP